MQVDAPAMCTWELLAYLGPHSFTSMADMSSGVPEIHIHVIKFLTQMTEIFILSID